MVLAGTPVFSANFFCDNLVLARIALICSDGVISLLLNDVKSFGNAGDFIAADAAQNLFVHAVGVNLHGDHVGPVNIPAIGDFLTVKKFLLVIV